MKISIIAFTDNGMEIADRLESGFSTDVSIDSDITRCARGGLSSWTEDHFPTSDALIYVGAIGIAIRAIAPLVKTKVRDPAVIVVDELGQFSIPVLSGHIGGANELALQVSEILDTIPVITTATDINNLFAVDSWAKSQGLNILNPQNIKSVSSKLLKGKEIHVKSDYSIKGKLPERVLLNDLKKNECYDVIISHRNHDVDDALILVPPIVTVGLGCRRDMDFEVIERRILNALDEEDCHILSMNSIASIDKKANERGILEFCEKYALPFNVFTAEELNGLEGDFTKSDFVKSVVEVDNVCERSAIFQSRGKLIRRKDAGEGVTVALAISEPDLSW